MKIFTKLLDSAGEFFKRSSYHPGVDRDFEETSSPVTKTENRHTIKTIPLAERLKEIDEKYDPIIEQARNQKQKK
jgi:ribosome-binding protein aMBF1 (putative translation factor)